MDLVSYLIGKKSGGGGSINLQSKEVTITENKTTNITPDTGYDGLSAVSVTTNVPGGGSINWEALGYSEEPSVMKSDYDYSKSIKDNWVPEQSLYIKFNNDMKLTYFPLVDTSITTIMESMFSNCMSLKSVALIDTQNVTRMNSMFYFCYALFDVPLFNTENVTTVQDMFTNCSVLEKVPLFNTKKVTTMRGMFDGCHSLKNVPLFDTSGITNNFGFYNTFYACHSLTDESLDNILQMCINATNYNGIKTLARLGFNSEYYPTSRIEALPHYADFIDAGWTIGY